MALWGSSGSDAWQQFYEPTTKQLGTSLSYVEQQNADRLREAMLAGQQLQQASNVTQAQNQTLAQQEANADFMNKLRGNLTGSGSGMPSGGGSIPTMPGGGGTVGGTGSGGYYYGGTGGTGGSGNIMSTELQQQYDPWSKYRDNAGAQLASQMGEASPSDIYRTKLAAMVSGQFSPTDPSYQFRFQEGQRAAERSLASRGLLNSGNAALELQQYGQGAASQEYGAQFGRLLQGMAGVEGAYDTQMNRLMQMAGVNLDPTAGGKLGVQAGQLGVEQGKLGLAGQELLNDWFLKNRELGIKEQLGYMAAMNGGVGGMGGSDWSAIFG